MPPNLPELPPTPPTRAPAGCRLRPGRTPQGDVAATVSCAPDENAANSGAYIDCTVAGAALKVPPVAARRRWRNVYSPAGSRSKKKSEPLSRTCSYQPIPKSHL